MRLPSRKDQVESIFVCALSACFVTACRSSLFLSPNCCRRNACSLRYSICSLPSDKSIKIAIEKWHTRFVPLLRTFFVPTDSYDFVQEFEAFVKNQSKLLRETFNEWDQNGDGYISEPVRVFPESQRRYFSPFGHKHTLLHSMIFFSQLNRSGTESFAYFSGAAL
jgi:hypothetical protein